MTDCLEVPESICEIAGITSWFLLYDRPALYRVIKVPRKYRGVSEIVTAFVIFFLVSLVIILQIKMIRFLKNIFYMIPCD